MPDSGTTAYFGVDISDLKKAMQDAKRSVQLANSEFKAAASECDNWSQSSAGLSAKLKQLNSTLDSQKDMLAILEEEYRQVSEKQGESSKGAELLKIKINNQKAAINNTQKAMNGYEDVLSDVNKAEKIAAATGKDVAEVLDDIANEAKDAEDGFTVLKGAVATFAGNMISNFVDVVKDGVSNLISLADETREYRIEMAKLDAAFKTAGHSTEAASKVYEDFYAILGESDRSVEAVNHLAEFTDSTEELSKWSTIAAGVTAKFGDSLPIEGLTEAANETSKVKQVTGVLADALNWASADSAVFSKSLSGNKAAMSAFNTAINEGLPIEDAFTAALGKMSTEQERSAAITNTLNSLYSVAAAEYNELTAETQEARRATAEMEEAQAKLGAEIEPLMTVVTKAKTAFYTYAINMLSAKEATSYLTEEQQRLIDSSIASGVALQNIKTASDANAVSISTEINYTRTLTNELFRLADVNGVVEEADRARVEFILGELNSALGTEYTMTGNIIGNYNNLKNSIYAVIEAKKAQLLLQEYEAGYVEAIKNIASQESARANQAVVLAQMQTEVEALEAEKRVAYKEWEGKESTILGSAAIANAETNLARKKKLLDDETAKYVEINNALKKSYDARNAYEQASTAILEGETEKAISILDNYGNSFTEKAETIDEANKSQIESLKANVINTSVQLGLLEAEYQTSQSNMTTEQKKEMESRIKQAQEEAQSAREEYYNVGGSMVEGLVKGVEDKDGNPIWNLAGKLKKIVTDAVEAAKKAADINSPSKKTMYIGEMLPEGLVVGAIKKRDKAIETVYELGADAIPKMEKAYQAAGEKNVDAFINGLEGYPRKHIPALTPEEQAAESLSKYPQGYKYLGDAGWFFFHNQEAYHRQGLMNKIYDAANAGKKVSIKHSTNYDEEQERITYASLEVYIDGEKIYNKQSSITAEEAATLEAVKAAEGIGKSVEKTAEKTAESIVKTAENTSDELKELQEKELEELKYHKDLGIITEAEYYAELISYRDKYFKEGSQEWENYTQEIAGYADSLAASIEEKQKSVADTQKKIAQSMVDEGNKTYSTISIVGENLNLSTPVLANVGADNDVLKQYNDMLDELTEKRGILPNQIANYLSEMGLSEGMAYVKALINASEQDFNNYVNSLIENSRLAEEISKKITVNQSAGLQEEILSQIKDIPSVFFEKGTDSAVSFGEALRNGLKEIFAEVNELIGTSLQKINTDSLKGIAPNLSNLNNKISAAKAMLGSEGMFVPNSVVNNYTQNIYSPTKVSRLDIYRNTKNLLGFSGGGA